MPEEPKQPQEGKQPKSDIFIARSIYPEAEAVFTAQYRSLQEIKADCIVVLDTNTLLVPYGIGKESLEKIKTTYKTLIDVNRLVVPAQVAREFAKIRPKKLSELYDNFSKKRDAQQGFDTGKYPLLADVPEYQQLLIQQEQINNLFDEYRNLLGKVLEHIENWFWNDPVSLVYSQLFNAAVVKDTSVSDDDVKRDLERNQIHKIPPAYKDAAKDDSGIGDLLIWKTILDVSAKEKKSILFVSGEEKADWWYRGNKTQLYPRYELIDEFRRVSGGQTFHIVKFSRFLDLFGAGQPVVDEVRSKEEVEAGAISDDDEADAILKVYIDEHRVLEAFEQGRFKFRTVRGIAKDAGLSRERCTEIIESLEAQRLLGRRTDERGTRWYVVASTENS
jgi:hypothetical protein